MNKMFSVILEATGLNSNAAMDLRVPAQGDYLAQWQDLQLAYLGLNKYAMAPAIPPAAHLILLMRCPMRL